MSKNINVLISILFMALSSKFTFIKKIRDIIADSWRTNEYSGTGKESYDLYPCFAAKGLAGSGGIRTSRGWR
jgi:hypothetical protein